jgi:hypothetical protein
LIEQHPVVVILSNAVQAAYNAGLMLAASGTAVVVSSLPALKAIRAKVGCALGVNSKVEATQRLWILAKGTYLFVNCRSRALATGVQMPPELVHIHRFAAPLAGDRRPSVVGLVRYLIGLPYGLLRAARFVVQHFSGAKWFIAPLAWSHDASAETKFGDVWIFHSKNILRPIRSYVNSFLIPKGGAPVCRCN